jgi:hypothetical protein
MMHSQQNIKIMYHLIILALKSYYLTVQDVYENSDIITRYFTDINGFKATILNYSFRITEHMW